MKKPTRIEDPKMIRHAADLVAAIDHLAADAEAADLPVMFTETEREALEKVASRLREYLP